MTAPLLVIDTSVAIYLLTPEPKQGQERRWQTAQQLLRVPKEDWILAMPTPVVGEILAGFPSEKQARAAQILAETFEILTLDFRAAEVVGRLAVASIRHRKKSASRQAVKIDVEIVACAVRWGAGGVCFLDGDHDRIATRASAELLTGPPTTFLPQQQDIFEPDP